MRKHFLARFSLSCPLEALFGGGGGKSVAVMRMATLLSVMLLPVMICVIHENYHVTNFDETAPKDPYSLAFFFVLCQ